MALEMNVWRKSGYSVGSNSQCVEVATGTGLVGVRDSKNPDGGHLAVRGRGLAGVPRGAAGGALR